jgi:tetratricopeptide (TPR) repeat protein
MLRTVGDRGGEATTLANMGAVYSDLGKKVKALEYLNQALPMLREVKNKSGEAVASYNIATIYYGAGQLKKAIDYLGQCVKLEKQVQDPNLTMHQALLTKWQQKFVGKVRKKKRNRKQPANHRQ